MKTKCLWSFSVLFHKHNEPTRLHWKQRCFHTSQYTCVMHTKYFRVSSLPHWVFKNSRSSAHQVSLVQQSWGNIQISTKRKQYNTTNIMIVTTPGIRSWTDKLYRLPMIIANDQTGEWPKLNAICRGYSLHHSFPNTIMNNFECFISLSFLMYKSLCVWHQSQK